MNARYPGTTGEVDKSFVAATPKAYETIAHELQVRILGGHYGPGDRLPSERQLAAHLGVSRPTVREALSALEARGLVVTHVGRGSYVAAREPVDDGDALGDDSPFEVLETRLVVEVAVCRLAAKRAPSKPDGVDLLRASVEALERVANPDAFPDELDQAFHRHVVSLTGNEYLMNLASPIWETMMQRLFITLRSHHWSAAETVRTAQEHRAIFEAIRRGDPDRSAFEMERHLRNVIDKLFNEEVDEGRPPTYLA